MNRARILKICVILVSVSYFFAPHFVNANTTKSVKLAGSFQELFAGAQVDAFVVSDAVLSFVDYTKRQVVGVTKDILSFNHSALKEVGAQISYLHNRSKIDIIEPITLVASTYKDLGNKVAKVGEEVAKKNTQTASLADSSISTGVNSILEKTFGTVIDKGADLFLPLFYNPDDYVLYIPEKFTSTNKNAGINQQGTSSSNSTDSQVSANLNNQNSNPSNQININQNSVYGESFRRIVDRILALENIVRNPVVNNYSTNVYSGVSPDALTNAISAAASSIGRTSSGASSGASTASLDALKSELLSNTDLLNTNIFSSITTTASTATSTFAGNLNVVGDAIFDGDIVASAYYGDGSHLTGISAGGSSLWATSSSDIYYTGGNVGIGTSTPAGDLEIFAGDNETDLLVSNSGVYGGLGALRIRAWNDVIGNGVNFDPQLDGGTFYFGRDNTLSKFIIQSGNVGIGTTTPNSDLSVQGGGNTPVEIGSWSEGGGANYASIYLNGDFTNGLNYNFVSSAGDKDLFINRPSGNNIHFREANGDDQMTILSGGNVGIGTDSPAEKLDINGALIFSGLYSRIDGSGISNMGGAGMSIGNVGGVMSINSDNGGRNLNILAAQTVIPGGNVGIGTTTPTAKLAITGSGTGTGRAFAIADSSNSDVFTVLDNGQTVLKTNAAFYVSGNSGYTSIEQNGVNLQAYSAIRWADYQTILRGVTGGLLVMDTSSTAYKSFGAGNGTFNGTLNVIGSTGAVTPGTSDMFSLIRPTDNASTWSQVATFALGTYDTNNLGNNYGPATRLDLKFRTAQNNLDYTPNFTAMTFLDNGKVGIGTTTPSAKLAITGSGTGTGQAFVIADSSNSQKFTILDNGNVGIGAGTPTTLFSVNDSTGQGLFTVDSNTSSGTFLMQAAYPHGQSITFKARDSGDGAISTIKSSDNNSIKLGVGGSGNGSVILSTGGSDRLTVNSSGNVGIGATTPLSPLHIVDANSYDTIGAGGIMFTYDASNVNRNAIANRFTNGDASLNKMTFRVSDGSATAPVNVMTLTGAGNVGIGTTTPTAKLAITGTAGTGDIFAIASSTNSRLLTFTSTGRLGIGTSNPSNLLEVSGGYAALGGVTIGGNNISFGALSSAMYWPSATIIETSADGLLKLSNYARSDFGRLQLGGTTSAFPAIKRNGAGIDFRLADDTGYATTTAQGGIFNGSVGIGTSTPSTRLTIVGAGSADTFAIASSSGANLLTVSSSGVLRVPAINTTAGSIQGSDNTGAGIGISNGNFNFASYAYIVGTQNTYRIKSTIGLGFSTDIFNVGNDVAISRLSAGVIGVGTGAAGNSGGTLIANTIGVGTTTPDQALVVTGSIRSTSLLGGATNLTTDASGNIIRDPSDERLKENIVAIDSGDALSKVLALRGVTFEWKDKTRFGAQNEVGFIAQEVQGVVPEAVSSGGDYLSLSVRPIVAVLVEAVKDLAKKIASLTERVQTKELCVGDTCVTESQLKALLQNAGVQSTASTSPTVINQVIVTGQEYSASEGNVAPVDSSSTTGTSTTSSDTPPAPIPEVPPTGDPVSMTDIVNVTSDTSSTSDSPIVTTN